MKALQVVLVCGSVVAGPATAQDWIDFDLLMQQNTDRMVMSSDGLGRETRTLDMGDGVSVVCDDRGCTGFDNSANGAIGCTFSIYTEIAAFAEACEVPLTAERSAVLDGAFRDIGAFIARNAVPPRSEDYPQDLLARRVTALKAKIAGSGEDICAKPFEGDHGMLLSAIIANPDPAGLQKILSTPRLPVMNPCL